MGFFGYNAGEDSNEHFGLYTLMFMYRNEQVMGKHNVPSLPAFLPDIIGLAAQTHDFMGQTETQEVSLKYISPLCLTCYSNPLVLHKPEGKELEVTDGTTASLFLWLTSVLYFLEKIAS